MEETCYGRNHLSYSHERMYRNITGDLYDQSQRRLARLPSELSRSRFSLSVQLLYNPSFSKKTFTIEMRNSENFPAPGVNEKRY